MSRPRLLDLFCGQGGAAQGYYRAGFDVTGVDIVAQPRYPFAFVQGDALEILQWGWPGVGALRGAFDAVHASPVCKLFSQATRRWRAEGREYPNQIPATRRLLESAGVPWVIENVPRAPLRPDFALCGCMFGLAIGEGYLVRERWFETSWRGFDLRSPCSHIGTGPISISGHGVDGYSRRKVGAIPLARRRLLMDCVWMDRNGLGEAIPPAYTEYIGERLLAEVERAEVERAEAEAAPARTAPDYGYVRCRTCGNMINRRSWAQCCGAPS